MDMRSLSLLALFACTPVPEEKVSDSAEEEKDSDSAEEEAQDEDGDGYSTDEDCDDADGTVHPGAEERCNEHDDDCDEEVDEEAVDGRIWYADFDEDGYGDPTTTVLTCDDCAESEDPTLACSGYVTDSTDCDDRVDSIHPGVEDRCDEQDNDCDGVIDESPNWDWCTDGDGDRFGDESTLVMSCISPGDNFVPYCGDCDDTNAQINAGAEDEPFCEQDGVDNDCDGVIDPCFRGADWYWTVSVQPDLSTDPACAVDYEVGAESWSGFCESCEFSFRVTGIATGDPRDDHGLADCGWSDFEYWTHTDSFTIDYSVWLYPAYFDRPVIYSYESYELTGVSYFYTDWYFETGWSYAYWHRCGESLEPEGAECVSAYAYTDDYYEEDPCPGDEGCLR